MSSSDIPSLLLQSTDARIAEAAKRVFSSHPIAPTAATTTSIATRPLTTSPPHYSHQGEQRNKTVSVAASTLTACASTESSKHTVMKKRPFDNSKPTTTTNNDDQFDLEEDKKLSSTERLQRSRERNRMHARKTRQRKKEHMQKLQNRADALKLEQIRLKQVVNEKNTASILVGLFQQPQQSNVNENGTADEDGMDARVEALLKRPVEDIPDASKIPELPALILPGQHSHKKANKGDESNNDEDVNSSKESSQAVAADAIMSEAEALDGIDYQLLGKDRSSCSPAELDKIRRERNRMHAKRTRDRKRIFMEEMEVMIRQLEEENALLQDHVDKMNGGSSGGNYHLGASAVGVDSSTFVSPELGPVPCPLANPSVSESSINNYDSYTQSSYQPPQDYESSSQSPSQPQQEPSSQQQQPSSSSNGDFLHQIESLLAAAGAFERQRSVAEINAISCAESDVTASTNRSDTSLCEEEEEGEGQQCCSKKQRLEDNVPNQVPSSITTTKLL